MLTVPDEPESLGSGYPWGSLSSSKTLYRVWAFTFRIFADGVRVLPNGVAEHLSTVETNLIFAEADQLKKFQADCV